MSLLMKSSASALMFLSFAASVPPAQAGEKPGVIFELRAAESKPAKGLTEAAVEGTRDKVYLHKEAALTNKDIVGAKATTENGEIAVEITLTKAGQGKLAKLTESHVGKPLALMLDGKVVFAPVVRDKILGDKVLVTGKFTKQEAERIAKGIQAK